MCARSPSHPFARSVPLVPSLQGGGQIGDPSRRPLDQTEGTFLQPKHHKTASKLDQFVGRQSNQSTRLDEGGSKGAE